MRWFTRGVMCGDITFLTFHSYNKTRLKAFVMLGRLAKNKSHSALEPVFYFIKKNKFLAK